MAPDFSSGFAVGEFRSLCKGYQKGLERSTSSLRGGFPRAQVAACCERHAGGRHASALNVIKGGSRLRQSLLIRE